jgi:hypothetical protein
MTQEGGFMNVRRLAQIAAEKISAAQNPSPRRYLDNIRRNLMSLLCKDEKLEVTGTVDDFGGMQTLTGDIAKAVMNLFCLAEVFKLDLAAAIEAEFGDKEEEPGKQEQTAGTATEKAPRLNGDGGQEGENEQEDSSASNAEKTDELTAGTSSGSSGGNGNDKLKQTYRKFFAEATSIELVEQTWKKEIAGNRDFDGKDKAELQPDYAAAKKRLSTK